MIQIKIFVEGDGGLLVPLNLDFLEKEITISPEQRDGTTLSVMESLSKLFRGSVILNPAIDYQEAKIGGGKKAVDCLRFNLEWRKARSYPFKGSGNGKSIQEQVIGGE